MALTIPTAQNNPTWPAQAVLDSTDLQASYLLGQSIGVISGFALTGISGGSSIVSGTLSAGSFTISGNVTNIASTNFVTNSASIGDRRDIVIASGSTVSVIAGTPSSIANWSVNSAVNPPIKPAIPSNSVILGEVYVPGTSAFTTPTTGWYVDKTAVYNNALSSYGGTISGTLAVTSGLTVGGNAVIASGTSAGGDLANTYPNPNIQGAYLLVSYSGQTTVSGNLSVGTFIVPFNKVEYSGGGARQPSINTSTGVMTVNKTGIYQIQYTTTMLSGSAVIETGITVSGAPNIVWWGSGGSAALSGGAMFTGNIVLPLSSGTQIYISVGTSTATTAQLYGQAFHYTWCSLAYLGLQ